MSQPSKKRPVSVSDATLDKFLKKTVRSVDKESETSLRPNFDDLQACETAVKASSSQGFCLNLSFIFHINNEFSSSCATSSFGRGV
jgi:hypothetical protein